MTQHPRQSTVRSEALFAEAQRYLVGGVNSPVRAFRAVGGSPRFIARGQGPYVWDVDGNRYTDYVCSWGPLILGHAHPQVVEAVAEAAARGTSYGAPTEAEVELARLVRQAMPSIEMVRFTSSGTEACMSALRLARAFTGRSKVVKFEGCYHGHADGLLVKAGSGAATFGVPDSAGVPASYAQETLVCPYNDLATLDELFDAHEGEIAAVIVEPVAANMGVAPPLPSFLEGLRQVTRKCGALLIFDEVITGFRVAPGGAQARYGVTPDLTCLGKVIGGGLPAAAYGGRRDIMEMVAPLGPVYQAGTLSGNPLAMAAGVATLKALGAPGVYERLETLGEALERGLRDSARRSGVEACVQRVGSVLTLFSGPGPVTDWATAKRADTRRYAAFFHAMLQRGVYLPPSQFEAWFVSLAHTEQDIAATVRAAGEALAEIRATAS